MTTESAETLRDALGAMVDDLIQRKGNVADLDEWLDGWTRRIAAARADAQPRLVAAMEEWEKAQTEAPTIAMRNRRAATILRDLAAATEASAGVVERVTGTPKIMELGLSTMQKIFDYAHARVTITQRDGLIEIEVWPKVGVSAYVILTPQDAEEVGEMIVRLADEIEPERPDNMVSLDSRRKRPMN